MGAPAPKRAWGEASPRADAIAAAALAYIDTHGLPALTIRALAAEMGSFPANLYRQISGRDDLLDRVLAMITAEAALPDLNPTDDWEGWLVEHAVRVRKTWSDHPNALPLLFRGQNPLQDQAERISAAFLAADLAPRDVLSGIYSYATYILGSLTLPMLTGSGDGASTGMADPLAGATPNLAEVERLAQHRFQGDLQRLDDELFVHGLRALLRGVRGARVVQRSART